MGTIADLLVATRGHKIYLDTNIFVYFLDKNTQFFDAAAALMHSLASRHAHAYTGQIAVAETMVGPYRSGNPRLIASALAFFAQKHVLTVVRHGDGAYQHAAQCRAQTGVKLIDALHIATALQAQCRYLITNDKAMRTSGQLQILQLSDYC
ncbi:type II toxin-antitoxin system VapC family toxin [Pseudoduganella danionis]|nr:type II toxin-antitoxin system VapC family toxin [Pseudoduganella danionis]